MHAIMLVRQKIPLVYRKLVLNDPRPAWAFVKSLILNPDDSIPPNE
jgi:hypothetical protein